MGKEGHIPPENRGVSIHDSPRKPNTIPTQNLQDRLAQTSSDARISTDASVNRNIENVIAQAKQGEYKPTNAQELANKTGLTPEQLQELLYFQSLHGGKEGGRHWNPYDSQKPMAQLHQLRGRVGRGDKQSYCLLFTETKSPQTFERLKSMERLHNGAELAELDLKLRGPGDIYGTLQSGLPMLKIANFSDTNLIIRAKKEAEKIFPDLHKYPKLLEKLQEVNIKQVSPD